MYKYLTVFCCFLFNLSVSQTLSFAVTGAISDNAGIPIEVGNVIALSAKDSSIIKGAIFLDGNFRLSGLSETNFLLKLSSLGYKDSIFSILKTNADTVLNLRSITLGINNTLKEIEINSKTPFFRNDGEKIIVNVENTGLNSSGTAIDVLRKSPGVIVSSNDNVSVFGKGGAIIYLDGQLIASSDVLKAIPSSDIRSIEIINNPSAKYDASGRAVINIITKRNNLQGYNGNIIQNFIYSKYMVSYSGLRFNFKKKKLSLSAGYGFLQGKVWSSDEYYRQFSDSNSVSTEMNNKIFETQRNANVNNYRFSIGYALDTSSSIDLQYNGYYSDIRTVTENENIIYDNHVPQFSLQTTTHGNPVLLNNSLNLVYNKKLDTLGSGLFAAAQYGVFSSTNAAMIDQSITYGTNTIALKRRSNGANDIQLITAQLDYNKSFLRLWKFEIGAKNSNIIKSSTINFDNLSSQGEWISDPDYFNGFDYKENILAGYLNTIFRKNKFNFRVGARVEQTNTNGFSHVLNKKVISRSYLNVFPSAYVGYDFTKDLTAGITYSERIIRPSYEDMDPFINYIDSLSSFRGNPYLLPEYSHSVEASLVYMKEASIGFGYVVTNGALKLVVDRLNDGSNAFIATTKNINKAETYLVRLTIPYELDWWTTSNSFGYSLNKFSYNNNGMVVENSKPLFYMSFYNEFRFKKLFSMEITYDYNSGGVDGIFIIKPYSVLSANIKKTFLKDRLTCRFSVNDILSSNVMAGKSNVPGYTVEYKSRIASNFYLLALNYKFGKYKGAGYQDKSVNKEEYNRIKSVK